METINLPDFNLVATYEHKVHNSLVTIQMALAGKIN
jgi:hypothetical protein